MWKILGLGRLGNKSLIVVNYFTLTFTCRLWFFSLLFNLNHVLWPRINLRFYVVVYVLSLHNNVILFWITFFIHRYIFCLKRFSDFELIKHFLVILFNFALFLKAIEFFDVLVTFLLEKGLYAWELIWGEIVLLFNWFTDTFDLRRFKHCSWCKVTVLMLDNLKWFFRNLSSCCERVHLILLTILINLRDLVRCCKLC